MRPAPPGAVVTALWGALPRHPGHSCELVSSSLLPPPPLLPPSSASLLAASPLLLLLGSEGGPCCCRCITPRLPTAAAAAGELLRGACEGLATLPPPPLWPVLPLALIVPSRPPPPVEGGADLDLPLIGSCLDIPVLSAPRPCPSPRPRSCEAARCTCVSGWARAPPGSGLCSSHLLTRVELEVDWSSVTMLSWTAWISGGERGGRGGRA